MKMVKFEKWFINSKKHGDYVINRAEKLLQMVDIKENQSYLEVGCGNGSVCKYIAEKYPWSVTGVDVDPKQIQIAQESSRDVPNIRFVEADATNIPFPDNNFDIVLSFGTTHHIHDWPKALSEIKRVLKPEGYFIYYDLVYPRLLAGLAKLLMRSYGIVTMPELNSFIVANGYREVSTSKRNSLVWYDYEAVYQSA
jgi:ubiquinone/menaquinone biosynthesis C-methylase UbiE